MTNVEDQTEQIQRMVHAWAVNKPGVPTEDELSAVLMTLVPSFGPDLSDDDIVALKDAITKVFTIRMDMGVLIHASDHEAWVQDRLGSTDWVQWDAYAQLLLNQGRSPLVVDKLDQSLNLILDHLGDPKVLGAWKRRGLVIGDVQSGKTGTYIGLMDKAADAGYRIFVVLTGNTESLRQQTQSRIDEGLLGQDSKPLSRSKVQLAHKPAAIGIGLLAELKNSVASMTTMTTDFRKSGLEAVSFRPGPDTLMVFITKKNATVLKNIAEWLSRQATAGGKIQVPLLFLDDEADFASVNTNAPEDDPTAINRAIREILEKFARSSYVGFTATPFANIFINDEIEEDLFPRDFIYGLDAPSNYVGPRSLFGDYSEDVADDVVRRIDDGEAEFPLGHRNLHPVSALPPTLSAALRTFLLANALRDLTGGRKEPRSMLVNVSRFNSVQAELGHLLEAELAAYRNAIRLHAKSYAAGGANPELAALEVTFQDEYSDLGIEWAEILDQLSPAVAEIEVRIMNRRRDKEYEERQLRAENPPRTIAVGGDLLSRGLTLDGLMVSYFYRRVTASDTLMQMGRWFGYRDGYERLTRIWTTDELVADYASTADSLEELRSELLRMRDQGLTPTQYGLAVKNHPTSLLITARNKMRAAQKGQKSISLRGRAIETHKVSALDSDIARNWEALEKLVTKARAENQNTEKRAARAQRVGWTGVDRHAIADFLQSYRAPASLTLFSGNALADFVRDAIAVDLHEWDIALIGGAGDSAQISGLTLNLTKRGIGWAPPDTYLISRSKQRVAGPGDVAKLLPPEIVDEVGQRFRASEGNARKNIPDREFVPYLPRPLLMLYPIQGGLDDGTTLSAPLVGAVIAIPERIGSGGRPSAAIDNSADVTYMLNAPAQRLWLQEFDEGDDDEY